MAAGLSPCLGPAPLTPCPTGAQVRKKGGPARCKPCATAWRRRTPDRARPPAETAEHRAVLAAWRAEVGPWCPGDETPGLPAHPGHLSDDLTVHHPAARVLFGPQVGTPKRVLCRSRNAAIGARLPVEPGSQRADAAVGQSGSRAGGPNP